MSFAIVSTAAGGLALFLLAMLMMTEGLKAFGGSGLRRLLGRWTSTPVRGVAAGMLVTALVQSSSAVTVAAIGFVNAGMLTLRQALGVIFGTNVGTTMTGWLVSLVGVGFKIDFFALPLIALGVTLRLMAGGKRTQGLGDALFDDLSRLRRLIQQWTKARAALSAGNGPPLVSLYDEIE